MAGRSPEEAAAIDRSKKREVVPIKGDSVPVDVVVAPLPEVVSRSEQRREEFREALDASFKKRLMEHTFAEGAYDPLRLRVSLSERPARDLIAPDGEVPLAATRRPMSYSFLAQNADKLGVLARVELVRDGDDVTTEPVWLVEGWFMQQFQSPAINDVQDELQVLVPWERAVRWLEKRPLPTSLLDPTNFGPIGSTELSTGRLQ
jgi:hypothetical protein